MHIKKDDKVKILAGKNKGKTGKVLQVLYLKKGNKKKIKVSVEGVNLLIKHIKSGREGEKGQRIEFPAPLDISNVMLICPKCGRPTRVGYKVLDVSEDNKKNKKKKVRICKKCKAII